MRDLKPFVVVNEFGREIGGVMLCEIYAVWATNGLNAIVAFARDGKLSLGSTMAYNIDWEFYGDFCAKLNGCDLIISNGVKIMTVLPITIVKQDKLPF